MTNGIAVGSPQVTMQDYEAMLYEEQFARSVRYDGWKLAFLVGMVVFGPEVLVHRALPPIRFVDFLLLALLGLRWLRALQVYGGFFFSYRVRVFSLFVLALTFMIVLSWMINVSSNRIGFYYKDLFIPVTFLRMIVIAAIASSYHLGERQLRQLMFGIAVIAFVSALLAFGQQYRVFGVGGLFDRLYNVEEARVYQRLEGTRGFRAYGTFNNANVFGGSLVMMAGMLLPFAVLSKGIRKLGFASVYGLIALALLFTSSSRTSLIGFLMVSVISLSCCLRKGSRLWAGLLIAVLGLGIIYLRFHFFELGLNARLQGLLGGVSGYDTRSFYSRWRLWSYSLELSKQSFLFGVGATKTIEQLTDNGYIFTLLRIGILGLGIYVLMLTTLLVRSIKAWLGESQPYVKTGMLALAMVVITHCIFEVTGEFFWRIRYEELFAAFMGMLCGLSGDILRRQAEYYLPAYSDAGPVPESAMSSGAM